MQQQIIKGDIPAKLNFDPLYSLLQRREQASPKLKERAAKICAIGVTSLCWLASQANKKYVDANIKTAEQFMEQLVQFQPSAAPFIMNQKQLLK